MDRTHRIHTLSVSGAEYIQLGQLVSSRCRYWSKALHGLIVTVIDSTIGAVQKSVDMHDADTLKQWIN